MTELRGRHGRNFEGTFMDLEGSDIALNNMLDELCYISRVEVLDRYDTESGKGRIALQLAKFERLKVIELAQKHGLVVAG